MWAQGHHKNTDVQLNRFKCNISKKAITHGRVTFTKIKEQSIDASDAPSAPSLGISLLSVGVGIFIKIKKRGSWLSLLSHPLSSCRGWSLAAASLTILMRIQSPFSTSILIVLRHMHLFIYGSPSSIWTITSYLYITVFYTPRSLPCFSFCSTVLQTASRRDWSFSSIVLHLTRRLIWEGLLNPSSSNTN